MRIIIVISALVTLSCAQTYDWSIGFSAFDNNDDKYLTDDEFRKTFLSYDANRDTFVDIPEFMSRYPLDTEVSASASLYIFFGLDILEPFNAINATELNFVFSRMAGADGKVSLEEYTALMNDVGEELMDALIVSIKTNATFISADTDNDMNLSREELGTMIFQYDVNDPTGIDLDEFKEFWGDDGTTKSADNAMRLFMMLDVDQDGYFLSDEEKQIVFDEFDHNGNQLISKDEFDTTLLKLFAVINNMRDLEAETNGEDPFGF